MKDGRNKKGVEKREETKGKLSRGQEEREREKGDERVGER